MARAAKQKDEKTLDLSLKVSDICTIMKVNRKAVYELVNQEAFPVFRMGRIIRIPRDPFLEWWKHAKKA